MKAIWGMDYDYISDKCYNRPMCPKCDAPVVRFNDGNYKCVSCRKKVNVTDSEMLKWLADREETKVEMMDCFRCGGKTCVETHFVKNKVTLEWQTAGGECKNCGMRFIV